MIHTLLAARQGDAVSTGCARIEDSADAGSITGSAITVYAGD